MNSISVSRNNLPEGEFKIGDTLYSVQDIENQLNAILSVQKIDNWEISLVLADDEYIRILNRDFRSKDEATDILSFCQLDEEESREPFPDNDDSIFYAGDIVISLDSLKKNAGDFGVSEEEEFSRLLIHGILHLSGLDHDTNSEKEPMLILQEQILEKITKLL